MKKKLLALIGVTALAATIFAGCGKDETSNAVVYSLYEDGSAPVEVPEEVSAEPEVPEVEFYAEVPLTIINDTPFDFWEMYFSEAESDTWGNNIIPSDKMFGAGQSVDFGTISFYEDAGVWDIFLIEPDGSKYEIYDVDMNESSKDHITIAIHYRDGKCVAEFESTAPADSDDSEE